MMDQAPPHSIESENSLIVSCLVDSDLYDEASGIVSATDFYHTKNREAWEAMGELAAAGSFDVMMLAEKVGDLAYWGRLVKDTPSVKRNVVAYAKIVKDRSHRRQVVMAGHNAMSYAMEVGDKSYLARAQSEIMDIGAERDGSGLVKVGDGLSGWLDSLELRFSGKDGGLSTGYEQLDYFTRGLRGKQLWIIAGRPKMGKTTLARCISEHVAKTHGPVAMFSLEMGSQELTDCMMASQGRVPLDKILTGEAAGDNDTAGNLAKAMHSVQAMPFYIDDTPGLPIADICSRARRMHRQTPLKLIIVDHIGLVSVEGETRTIAIGKASMALKNLAKELDTTVIALSQLNRDLEKRVNKKPLMSDLRESGNLEQDADKIIFVYRDEVYDEMSPHKGLAEIIIGAQRAGKTGSFPLISRLDISRFENCDRMYDLSETRAQSKGFD